MPNEKNKQAVKDLREKLASAKSVIFAHYHGLSASEVGNLREELKQNSNEILVTKNTILKIALKEEGYEEDLSKTLQGPVATVIGYEDELSPLKTLTDFAKEKELPNIQAGFIEKTFTLKEKLEELAKIPSKEVLIAKMIGGFKSPIIGIVNVLGASQKNFVYALSQIANTKK